jgi:hypothetical protein
MSGLVSTPATLLALLIATSSVSCSRADPEARAQGETQPVADKEVAPTLKMDELVGKRAAIGAVAGAMGGRRARRKAERQAAQQGAEQAQAQSQRTLDTFKRAAGMCLESRGYSVK